MMMEPDFSKFINEITSRDLSNTLERSFVAVDECLNRPEIIRLVESLVGRGLVFIAGPIWHQIRVLADSTLVSTPGTPDRNSPSQIGRDIGKPLKHFSWSDLEVVQSLVAWLDTYNKVILLTEDVKTDKKGLRKLLNKLVKPHINSYHRNRISFVVLYKKGKTNIEDYCRKVEQIVEDVALPFGYIEEFL